MHFKEIPFSKPCRAFKKSTKHCANLDFSPVLPSINVSVGADHVLIKMIFHNSCLIRLFQEKMSVFKCPAMAHSLRSQCQITQNNFVFVFFLFFVRSCLTSNYQDHMDDLEPRNTNLPILLCMLKGYSCFNTPCVTAFSLPFLNKS